MAPVHCFAVRGSFVFFSRNSSKLAANTQPTLWGVLLEFECIQMNGACLSPPNFTARACMIQRMAHAGVCRACQRPHRALTKLNHHHHMLPARCKLQGDRGCRRGGPTAAVRHYHVGEEPPMLHFQRGSVAATGGAEYVCSTAWSFTYVYIIAYARANVVAVCRASTWHSVACNGASVCP